MSAGRPGVLRQLVRAFWPDLRRYGRLVTVSYVFRAVAVTGGVLAPWPLKLLIDHVIVDPSPVTIATLRVEGQPGTLLVTLET